jgi:hypothetical protein
MERGTLETTQTRREIARLTREAVQAAASVAGVSAGGLARRLQRVGDVGRGAFGNLGLGIQQAIFAFDDFFSVTGGLDQRLRAAGNNISQLGFIVGGTAGLIGGVLVSALAQGAVALLKWRTQGVETADTQKALNESLARQKTLVDQLAESYRAVADAISEAGFTQETRGLRRQQGLARSVRDRQDEQLRERIADSDPTVRRERGIQAARQRELDGTIEAAERLRLQQEIRDSQRRSEEAARRAQQSPGVSPRDAAFAISSQATAAAAAASLTGLTAEQRSAEARRGFPTSPAAAEAQREASDRRAALLRSLDQARNAEERRRIAVGAIDAEQQRIRGTITTGVSGFFDPANEARRQAIEALEELRVQLEKGFRAAANEVAASAIESAIEASDRIGRAQAVLADAIQSGTSETSAALERANQSLLDAQRRLESAQEAGDTVAASAARDQIVATQDSIAAFDSVARSVATFAETLDRTSRQLADTVVSEATIAEQQAIRDRNAAGARRDTTGNSSASLEEFDFLQRRRERLLEQRQSAEDAAAQLDARRQRAIQQFETDAAAGALGPEVQNEIRRRDEAQRIIDDRNATAAQRAEALIQRNQAEAQLSRQFELSDAGFGLRAATNDFDAEQQQRNQREDDILRGRELAQTEAQRAGRELADNLRGIDSFFEQQVSDGAIQQVDADAQREAARRRAIDESFRGQAPALFALADSVQNAVLQGPSRAALNASDISTSEGARELNRLIRGDDAARDVNLVELQKQTTKLDELIQAVRDNGAEIAN